MKQLTDLWPSERLLALSNPRMRRDANASEHLEPGIDGPQKPVNPSALQALSVWLNVPKKKLRRARVQKEMQRVGGMFLY